eukprot:2376610-Alexandrium_andersonii.AAC.1
MGDAVTPRRREGPVTHTGPDNHNTWNPTAWDRKVLTALEVALRIAAFARGRTSPGEAPAADGDQAAPQGRA